MLDEILETLGLHTVGDWREASERAFIGLEAKALERRATSDHVPEELKLLLIGAQFAKIPEELLGRISEDVEEDGKKYTRLCDIDVWVRVGKFPVSGWDKVSSKKTAKKLSIKDTDLVKIGVRKFNATMAATSKEKVEEINRMVRSLVLSRAEVMAEKKDDK